MGAVWGLEIGWGAGLLAASEAGEPGGPEESFEAVNAVAVAVAVA